MNKTIRIAVGMLTLTFAKFSFADEETPLPVASFMMQFPTMKYSTGTVKTTESGVTTLDKTRRLSTQPLDSGSVGASIDKFAVYYYPFDDDNRIASVAYMVRNNVQVGFDFALNSFHSDKRPTNTSSIGHGYWIYHYAALGPFFTETGLVTYFADDKYQVTDNDVTTTVRVKETYGKLTFSLTYPIAKNMSWNFGPYITTDTYKSSGDKTVVINQFVLSLANIRIKW